LGYVMQVHCPGEGGKADVTVVDHVKLIRNRPDLIFEGRIHEQILPAIRRAGGDVAFTDAFVVHSGSDHRPEARRRKLDRDFRLLELDLQDRPNHPFVLFNLGMTHADAGQHEQAINALRRSIEVASPSESHVRKAYALLVGSLGQAARHEDAWQVCQEGRQLYPDDRELLFREGVLQQHFHRLQDAERAYLQILQNQDERHFSSIDQGILGHKTRHNLALVYEDMGELARAEAQWRKAVAETPAYRIGWRGLGEILLRQGKLDATNEVVQTLLSDGAISDDLRVEGQILAGRAAMECGDVARAKEMFRNAVEAIPADIHAWHGWCRFLFEFGDLVETVTSLRRLIDLAPEDGATYHNLGAVYLRQGLYEEAIEAFRKSLCRRPDSESTRRHLNEALQAAGRIDEAMAERQDVLSPSTGSPRAIETDHPR
jgi:tetratricopeptide (TPR) repeat protein